MPKCYFNKVALLRETSFSKCIYKVSEKNDAEAYSEISQTSKMEPFAQIVTFSR